MAWLGLSLAATSRSAAPPVNPSPPMGEGFFVSWARSRFRNANLRKVENALSDAQIAQAPADFVKEVRSLSVAPRRCVRQIGRYPRSCDRSWSAASLTPMSARKMGRRI
jgi:hypothetical protein